MGTWADGNNFPHRGFRDTQDVGEWVIDVPIGATGAVGTTVGPSGVTIARSNTGLYTIVYPPMATAYFFFTFESADSSPTVFKAVLTAKDTTAGTAGFTTFDDAATAADPEDGSHVIIRCVGRSR